MELDSVVSLQAMLGYLNFAGGKPDARFQKQLNEAYAFLAEHGAAQPHVALEEGLRARLSELRASGSSAFRDSAQAEAVLTLVFELVLPAYREHHADLLFHLNDRELFQPFFLARVFEAVLNQGPPWDEERRIVVGALTRLDDFVGHRPIAVLETRPKGEPYPHERVRPIPLYIREAGVAYGRYQGLVSKALEILAQTDPSLLGEACLDPELLDELAVDPRAYDHASPVNRRPNYVFGEWDPHLIDSQGRYRRYVARQVTLEALLERVEHEGKVERAELLFEAAAVLAGTMLMATGTSGSGPSTHDSTTTLATLMPRIAQYRDAFYARLLASISEDHGARLRAEAQSTRQPFGGARQHLNQYLARHRAAQLQQRQLALLFAEMGYPEASRREAARIPAVSVRLLSDIHGRLTTVHLLIDQGRLARAAALMPEIEDLLHRGIACGALVDPWNILGYQGLFPLFAAREDSIRDPRTDELVLLMEQIFSLYSRLVSEAAAVGDQRLREGLLEAYRQLAAWWDRFATVEVSDVHRVHGGESVTSAELVATALQHWHERGETAADLAFWREHLEGFQSPKAFALVVDALLRKEDYRAAMALLMNWLGQAETVPLENGEYSFHGLALRWLFGVAGTESSTQDRASAGSWPLVKKFFDYLEANAEDYWHVPSLESDQNGWRARPKEEEEDIYSAAYDNVTFRDSADDNQEGSVADGNEVGAEFYLMRKEQLLAPRLRFLSTVARLWQVAARADLEDDVHRAKARQERREVFQTWLAAARANQEKLLSLLDTIHERQLPEPLGSYDSLVEYDQRRAVKEQLLYATITTALDMTLAVGTLEGALGEAAVEPEPDRTRPDWEMLGIQLEQALLNGDTTETRSLLPRFLARFKEEPLLFVALADGGQPRQILRVRIAQAVVRALATNLPRLGLLKETHHVLKTAHAMEQAHAPKGRGVTEFNHLFQAAFQAVVELVVESAFEWPASTARDQHLVDTLEALTRPFLRLWIEHSQSLQLSTLEAVFADHEWNALRRFVQTYGHDLFHAKFMTLANLRGILHRGVAVYLDYLQENPDPLQPVKLVDDLDRAIRRGDAERWLQLILQSLVENYEEYKDYNTTTPQSDYGENLHLLLDFLRLKAQYERHAWRLRPLVLAHEVLARQGRMDLAVSWEEAFARLTQELAAQYVGRLEALERTHGMRLRTVSDLVQERFIKPLAQDRLCALIEPAMEEAREQEVGRAFQRLEKELQPLTATPTGVGLDVPQWLRRLQAEVQRVRTAETAIASLAEGFLEVPSKPLTYDELKNQLDDWDRPG
jgi:hypothetical protein